MTDNSGTSREILTALRKNLAQYFNIEELRTLCFDLGIEDENLPNARDSMSRELVKRCEEHRKISALLAKCRELRPNGDWPTLPDAHPIPAPLEPSPPEAPIPSKAGEASNDIIDRPISGGKGCYLRYGKLVIVVLLTIAVICVTVIVTNPEPLKQVLGLVTPMSTLTSTPSARPTYTPTRTPTPSFTPTSAVVALRTWSGRYVTVTDITTTWKLNAQDTPIGDRQKFTLLCLADGKAAFQISNRFVSALDDEDDRNWELRAVATNRLAWEEFTLVNPATLPPTPWSCDQVLKQLQQSEVSLAFQTSHEKDGKNRFVTAMGQDADWVLKAETTVLDKYEKFTAINLASAPTPTPCAVCAGCIVGQRYGCSANLPAEQVPYCTETLTLTSPVTATQIRIEMTRRVLKDYGYSLYEVEAYGPGNSQMNLLKEGTVVASSTEDDRYIAPYAIDGNLLSRWASAKCCNGRDCSKDDKGNLKCDNPASQDPQWLKIILPRPATIDRIVLKWERAYAVEYCVIVNP